MRSTSSTRIGASAAGRSLIGCFGVDGSWLEGKVGIASMISSSKEFHQTRRRLTGPCKTLGPWTCMGLLPLTTETGHDAEVAARQFFHLMNGGQAESTRPAAMTCAG